MQASVHESVICLVNVETSRDQVTITDISVVDYPMSIPSLDLILVNLFKK